MPGSDLAYTILLFLLIIKYFLSINNNRWLRWVFFCLSKVVNGSEVGRVDVSTQVMLAGGNSRRD